MKGRRSPLRERRSSRDPSGIAARRPLPRGRRAGSRGCAGFTLAELLVTLAVLAILSAIGVPYLLSFAPGFRVNGAVRQVVADFRLARLTAVQRGRNVLIEFDPAAAAYTMVYDADGDGAVGVPPDEVIKTVSIPALYKRIEFSAYSGGTNWNGDPLPGDGVSFTGDLALFKSEGTAKGGTVYLRPAKDAGARSVRERAVTIFGSTGRARVYRWTGTGWD